MATMYSPISMHAEDTGVPQGEGESSRDKRHSRTACERCRGRKVRCDIDSGAPCHSCRVDQLLANLHNQRGGSSRRWHARGRATILFLLLSIYLTILSYSYICISDELLQSCLLSDSLTCVFHVSLVVSLHVSFVSACYGLGAALVPPWSRPDVGLAVS